jgi:uncharacterized membrane protein
VSDSTDRDEGTGDKIAAWILYALQLLFEFLLLLFSAFSVMATDPCGTGVDEPRVCEGYYFATAFYGFWLVLLVTAIAVPVLIIRARRRRWLRPVLGIVVLTVAAVVYIALVAQ